MDDLERAMNISGSAMRNILARIAAPLLLASALAAQQQPQQQQPHPEHWGYDTSHGPSHWAQLNPEFAECSQGHHQSPIDIRNPKKADLPPIEFHYDPSPLDIIDNGHTIMINYAPGSFISVGGKKYQFKQFHFHRPSEERIHGKHYEMSLHLVHADEQGKLAVVAVLLQKGEDNHLVHVLWDDMPKEKDKEEHINNVQIDADGLLPTDRGYYTFTGSLTTPPCSEDVTWFVLKHPLTVSPAEIDQFSKLYRDNARPTQPLYDRSVLESK
jgi:carbonic anhydrase